MAFYETGDENCQLPPTQFRRYYIHNEVVPFEEDSTHEFKGHRNLSVEDVPEKEAGKERTARAVSRALNAFINTGKGGTVYIGIIDSGQVKGIRMTQYQKDHHLLALQYLFSRYRPTLPRHRWDVEFVIVVKKSEVELMTQISDENTAELKDPRRLQEHKLSTSKDCWCDRDNIARVNYGYIPPPYVIEIKIHPFDPKDVRNQSNDIINLCPIYENEEKKAFFRRQACTMSYSMQEIYELTVQDVKKHFHMQITELEQKLARLKNEKN